MIKGFVSQRNSIKQEKGFIFSERFWCVLFKLTLDNFDKKLRMADLLTTIIRPRNPIVSKWFVMIDD